MNTVEVSQISTTSSDESLALAGRLGANIKGGEVIELISDLGGGKTTFVRGLVRGAGSNDQVSSPSFTLTNQYRAHELTIHHFDFYRLHDPGLLREELAEILQDPNNVVVIEWADVVVDVLPEERLKISIRPTGETERTYSLQYPSRLEYLFQGV